MLVNITVMCLVMLTAVTTAVAQETPIMRKINVEVFPVSSLQTSNSCTLGLVHRRDSFNLSTLFNFAGLNDSNILYFNVMIVDKSNQEERRLTELIGPTIYHKDGCHPGPLDRGRCVCKMYWDTSMLVICNITADCKYSGTLFLAQMRHNLTVYNSISFPVYPKVYGPFSGCKGHHERRVIADPFNSNDSTSSCSRGLIHGVDSFNISAVIRLTGLNRDDVNGSRVALMESDEVINLAEPDDSWRICDVNLSTTPSARYTCGCVRADGHLISVTCNVTAHCLFSGKKYHVSLWHAGRYFPSDDIVLPAVYAYCDDKPDEIPFHVEIDGELVEIHLSNCTRQLTMSTFHLFEFCTEGSGPTDVLEINRNGVVMGRSANSCVAVNASIERELSDYTFLVYSSCNVSFQCIIVGMDVTRIPPTPTNSTSPPRQSTPSPYQRYRHSLIIVLPILLMVTIIGALYFDYFYNERETDRISTFSDERQSRIVTGLNAEIRSLTSTDNSTVREQTTLRTDTSVDDLFVEVISPEIGQRSCSSIDDCALDVHKTISVASSFLTDTKESISIRFPL